MFVPGPLFSAVDTLRAGGGGDGVLEWVGGSLRNPPLPPLGGCKVRNQCTYGSEAQ